MRLSVSSRECGFLPYSGADAVRTRDTLMQEEVVDICVLQASVLGLHTAVEAVQIIAVKDTRYNPTRFIRNVTCDKEASRNYSPLMYFVFVSLTQMETTVALL